MENILDLGKHLGKACQDPHVSHGSSMLNQVAAQVPVPKAFLEKSTKVAVRTPRGDVPIVGAKKVGKRSYSGSGQQCWGGENDEQVIGGEMIGKVIGNMTTKW